MIRTEMPIGELEKLLKYLKTFKNVKTIYNIVIINKKHIIKTDKGNFLIKDLKKEVDIL